MRLCEQVDEWYVLRTTQNGECVCLFSVPRLTPVERPSTLLRCFFFFFHLDSCFQSLSPDQV